MKHLSGIFLLFELLFAYSAASAQTLERLKYTPGLQGGNVAPTTMAYSDKYGLFVAGRFDGWGINAGQVVQLTTSDDTPNPNFPRLYDGAASDIISDGNNGWFVVNYHGIPFTTINETDNATYNIPVVLHILADNSIDQDFKIITNDWASSQIAPKIVLWNNTLYISGKANDPSHSSSLKAYDAHTGAVKPAPSLIAPDGLHNCVLNNGTLYIAGRQITSYNGTAINRGLIAIDLATGAMKNWGNFAGNSASGGYGEVYAENNNLSVIGNKVLVGTSNYGPYTYKISAFDDVTGLTPLWEKNFTYQPSSRIFCANSQRVYYPLANCLNCPEVRIGALSVSTGADDVTWNSQLTALQAPLTSPLLQVELGTINCTENIVYVGGVFSRVNNAMQKSIAALSATTGALTTWNPGIGGASSFPYTIRPFDNKIFLLNPYLYKFKPTRSVALIDPITQEPVAKNFDYLPLNDDLNASQNLQTSVSALAVVGDALWLGGQLAGGRGLGAYNLLTGDTLTKKQIQFFSQNQQNNAIKQLAIVDTVAYVLGPFDRVNNSSRQELAAVSVNGNVQPFTISVQQGYGYTGIEHFEIVGDRLYLSGNFTKINGETRNYIACVNRFTGQLLDWTPAIASVYNPSEPANMTKFDVTGKGIFFSGMYTRIGTTNIPNGHRNFLIDQTSGKLIRSWGDGEQILSSTTKDKYLFLSYKSERQRCAASGSGSLDYYDLEYNTPAPNCIPVRSSPLSKAGQLVFAGQTLYTIRGYYYGIPNAPLQMMRVKFPSGFFHDEISYFPKQGNNLGPVTVNFYGYDLGVGTKVRLLQAGQQPIVVPDSLLYYPEPFRVEAVINLKNKSIGKWDIELTTARGKRIVIPNGFQVNLPLPPTIRIRLNGTGVARAGSTVKTTMVISNRGEIDVRMIPIYISVPFKSKIKIPVDTTHVGTYSTPDSISTVKIDHQGGVPYDGSLGIIVIPKIGAGETVEIPMTVAPGNFNSPMVIQAHAGGLQPPSSPALAALLGYLGISEDCWIQLVHDAKSLLSDIPAVECVDKVKEIVEHANPEEGKPPGKPFDYISASVQAIIPCGETAAVVFGGELVVAAGAFAKTLHKALEFYSDVNSAIEMYKDVKETLEKCFPVATEHIASLVTQFIRSGDPNDKIGPSGAGKQRYISADTPLGYVIHFENIPSATAAAQFVNILDTLDRTKFDFSTFQFGYFNVADSVFKASPGRKHFLTDWDLRPGKNLIVRMEASFNDSTGILRTTYTALDPQTMELTTDAVLGFLPPNQVSPQGEGSIFFTIEAKAALPHSTTISNRASIIFDYNAAIPTPVWTNVVDNIKPASQVVALPTVSSDTTFSVQWSGSDTGSGTSLYDLYAATNNGPYKLLAHSTRLTSLTVTGQPDSTYKFYTIAVDSVGNQEIAPLSFDTQTTIKVNTLIESLQNGNWDATTTWSCGCIPSNTSTITIGHLVTIPANKNVHIRQVKYKADGKLKFSPGSNLEFTN